MISTTVIELAKMEQALSTLAMPDELSQLAPAVNIYQNHKAHGLEEPMTAVAIVGGTWAVGCTSVIY